MNNEEILRNKEQVTFTPCLDCRNDATIYQDDEYQTANTNKRMQDTNLEPVAVPDKTKNYDVVEK